jgi:hypothetical protein
VVLFGALCAGLLTLALFLADPRMHVPSDALFIVATVAASSRLQRLAGRRFRLARQSRPG